jgi:hypothetical protein
MIAKDPRKIQKKPPYSGKQQPSPGVDHGESRYKGTGRLKGRHALITAADSGIGRAVAREGADIAISYLSEETDARETEPSLPKPVARLSCCPVTL